MPAPVATTVSGVRVAILDKPPPQLPAPQGLLRPPAGTSGNFPPLPGEHMSVGRLPCTAGESQQPGECVLSGGCVLLHGRQQPGVCVFSGGCVFFSSQLSITNCCFLFLGAANRGPQPHPHPLTQVYRTGTYNPFYPPYPEYVSVGARRRGLGWDKVIN